MSSRSTSTFRRPRRKSCLTSFTSPSICTKQWTRSGGGAPDAYGSSGRQPVDRYEVPLVDAPSGDEPRAAGSIARPGEERSAGRPSVGAQGALPAVLGVHLHGGGGAVLSAVVLAGDAQPTPADGQSGVDDLAPLAQHPYLLTASDHQRRVRGSQRHDPTSEEDGSRVPKRGKLQDGTLLPLWRTRSLSTRKPIEPYFYSPQKNKNKKILPYRCRSCVPTRRLDRHHIWSSFSVPPFWFRCRTYSK